MVFNHVGCKIVRQHKQSKMVGECYEMIEVVIVNNGMATQWFKAWVLSVVGSKMLIIEKSYTWLK